jgi:hypothetical protein
MVLSRPEGNLFACTAPKEVEEVFVLYSPILRLVISGRLIETTAEHPFYVIGAGWKRAAELARNDVLASHNETTGVVNEIEETGREATVYNLRVADWHTYFVGDIDWGFSVWAHNACPVELDAVKDAAEIAANGGKKFKIVEGSRTIGYHADRPSAERWLDLASDPAIGRLRPDEAETALRVEQNQGTTLRRYNPPPGSKGDWIDGNNVIYDGVSPAPSAHFANQLDNWKASLADHIAKVDRAVVDLNGRGLTPAQVQQIRDHINGLSAADKAKIILLE